MVKIVKYTLVENFQLEAWAQFARRKIPPRMRKHSALTERVR